MPDDENPFSPRHLQLVAKEGAPETAEEGYGVFTVHIVTTADGLKANLLISPSILKRTLANGGYWDLDDEDAYLELELNDLKTGTHYVRRMGKVRIMAGVEDFDISGWDTPPPEFDDLTECLPTRAPKWRHS